MNKKVGIKTDYVNRLLVIQELIIGDLAGLVAFLGNGFFVVTSDAAEELAEMGIDYEPVEIVQGVPPFVREFIKESYTEKGLIPPF